jgi:hypothetical protein
MKVLKCLPQGERLWDRTSSASAVPWTHACCLHRLIEQGEAHILHKQQQRAAYSVNYTSL